MRKTQAKKKTTKKKVTKKKSTEATLMLAMKRTVSREMVVERNRLTTILERRWPANLNPVAIQGSLHNLRTKCDKKFSDLDKLRTDVEALKASVTLIQRLLASEERSR